jgi:TDG/mug DNA glycosylase family protein
VRFAPTLRVGATFPAKCINFPAMRRSGRHRRSIERGGRDAARRDAAQVAPAKRSRSGIPRAERGGRGGSEAPLGDVLVPRPRILFVGINPSLTSGRVGHHFAGPGNPFWRLLRAAAIVPEALTYEDDARLAEFNLALTNLCPRATRSAAELSAEEMERGRRLLARKIARLKPAVVAFVGLTLYQRYFGHPRSGGPGAKDERVFGARVFVVPNPSGLNAAFPGFRHKLVWYETLREFADDAAVERSIPETGSRER